MIVKFQPRSLWPLTAGKTIFRRISTCSVLQSYPKALQGQPIWHGPTLSISQTCLCSNRQYLRPPDKSPGFPSYHPNGARNVDPEPFGRGPTTSAHISCRLRHTSLPADTRTDIHLHLGRLQLILSNSLLYSPSAALRNDTSFLPSRLRRSNRASRPSRLQIDAWLSPFYRLPPSHDSPPHQVQAPHAAMRNSRARNSGHHR